MREIIRRLFGGKKNESGEQGKSAERDPWEGSSAEYITFFKKELDSIARALSGSEFEVKVRFNRETGHAELFIPEIVIADVVSQGEMGCPYEIIIRSEIISKDRSDIFRRHIPAKIV